MKVGLKKRESNWLSISENRVILYLSSIWYRLVTDRRKDGLTHGAPRCLSRCYCKWCVFRQIIILLKKQDCSPAVVVAECPWMMSGRCMRLSDGQLIAVWAQALVRFIAQLNRRLQLTERGELSATAYCRWTPPLTNVFTRPAQSSLYGINTIPLH